MAFVPDRMNEDRIAYLAEKIASSYMQGKASFGIEEYISTFMDVYDASKQIIAKREQDKINAMNNISINQLMDEAVLEESQTSKINRIL